MEFWLEKEAILASHRKGDLGCLYWSRMVFCFDLVFVLFEMFQLTKTTCGD